MAYYTCSVCGEKVERDLIFYTNHTEAHIVEEVKKKHPDWSEKNGLCSRCLEFYRKTMGKQA